MYVGNLEVLSLTYYWFIILINLPPVKLFLAVETISAARAKKSENRKNKLHLAKNLGQIKNVVEVTAV